MIRKLRTWLGRVIRDVQRKASGLGPELTAKLDIATRLHAQKRGDKNKLYALHAPEAECIAKAKAITPYEFGVKVSVAVTAKEGLVVGMRSMPGNPYDGHRGAVSWNRLKSSSGTCPRSCWRTEVVAAQKHQTARGWWSAIRGGCPIGSRSFSSADRSWNL